MQFSWLPINSAGAHSRSIPSADALRLQSGAALTAEARFVNPSMDPSEENIRSGASLLFLFGYVRYRDEAGVIRETGFGRQFDPEINRFQ